MNVCEHVVAAISLAQQRNFTATDSRDELLHRYWADSQCRIQRWRDTIHSLEQSLRNGDGARITSSYDMFGEVFFANVFTVVATAQINRSEQPEASINAMAYGVRESSGQIVCRAKKVVENATQLALRQRSKMNITIQHLRRAVQRSETWIDLMLAFIPDTGPEVMAGLAANNDRNQLFRANIRTLQRSGKQHEFLAKLESEVIAQFREAPIQDTGNEELNDRILTNVIRAIGDQPKKTLGSATSTPTLPTPPRSSHGGLTAS